MSTIRSVTPDPSLFHKLGARSRALPLVVTELIDNSLDSWTEMPKSKKEGKELTVEISAGEQKDGLFIIKDNAGGMTQDELIHAMTVAYSKKTNQKKLIGSFGFGLKSAAMYIGSKFSIYTVSYKDPKTVNFVEFDKEKFMKKQGDDQWKLEFKQLSMKEANLQKVFFPYEHGTQITIKNERYRSANQKGIIKKLSRTFAARIQEGEDNSYNKDKMNIELSLGGRVFKIKPSGSFYSKWNKSLEEVNDHIKKQREVLKKIQNQNQNKLEKDQINLLKDAKDTGFLKSNESNQSDPVKQEAVVIPKKINWLIEIPGIKKIERQKIKGSEKYVSGRIGILDRGMGHNNHYGFDLFKYGRLIEEHVLDKSYKNKEIGLRASVHNARIAGQLFLDDWDTDHQKVSFLKDSDDWFNLIEFVEKEVKDFLKVSSALQNPNKIILEEYQINSNTPQVVAEKKFKRNIETIEKKTRKAIKSSAFKSILKEIDTKKDAEEEIKVKNKQKIQTNTKLLSFTPRLEIRSHGIDSPMFKVNHSKKDGKPYLKVILNRDHPFLEDRESAELNTIGDFLIHDCYASFILKNKPNLTHEDFLELRGALLREYKSSH